LSNVFRHSRLEEHDNPTHPVVVAASERIVELSTRKSAVADALDALRANRPAGHHPDEIVAMLNAAAVGHVRENDPLIARTARCEL
jgi:hypothetical protein